MPVKSIERMPPRDITPSARLVEGFMYFFNVWIIFVIIHLGSKFVLTDIISRFLHQPFAEGVLLLSVVMGVTGWIFRLPFTRFVGNTISTFWWGVVWMMFILTLRTVITFGFAVYGLTLVVSVAVMMNNFRFHVDLSRDAKNNASNNRPGSFSG